MARVSPEASQVELSLRPFYAAHMVRTATKVVRLPSGMVRRAAAAIFSVAISSRRRT